MKIEVLFSEDCCLYGELGNIMYLKKCLPEAEFIYTELRDEPKFVSEEINLIYMGATTERTQEKIIKKLQPHKEKIQQLIEDGTAFLFTGNAFEVFGEYIENPDGSKIDGLNIFDTYAKRDMVNRHNELFIGKLDDLEIVGFKSQFTQSFGDNSNNFFMEVVKGTGLNNSSKLEGLRVNNFFGTYLIGPILPLNPKFTRYLLELLGVKNIQLAFENLSIEAYERRLKEFKERT